MHINTGLTDREKESLLKFFLTNGELTCDDNGTHTFRFFTKEYVFDDFDKGIASLILKAMDNLRNSIFN